MDRATSSACSIRTLRRRRSRDIAGRNLATIFAGLEDRFDVLLAPEYDEDVDEEE